MRVELHNPGCPPSPTALLRGPPGVAGALSPSLPPTAGDAAFLPAELGSCSAGARGTTMKELLNEAVQF